MKLYGIPNCSTVKKARQWLDERGIGYEFHDFKKDGVPSTLMKTLMKLHGWEALINRAGPTWRKLSDERKAEVKNATSALAVMQENPSVIKRPIIDQDGQYQIGFSEDNYAAFFGE
jgi:arsenate reductase (glutaredoxin)